METGIFWLTQANARRLAGWRRNSIPRYLNTSQLRVMYEGCVSHVYFRHFLRARIWMSSPSPAHSSQFIPARHREHRTSRGMICIFGKKNRARFCKSDGRYHTCGVVINRFSFVLSIVLTSWSNNGFDIDIIRDECNVFSMCSLAFQTNIRSLHCNSFDLYFNINFVRWTYVSRNNFILQYMYIIHIVYIKIIYK